MGTAAGLAVPRANRKLKNVASALHGSCAMDSTETTGGFRADRQYNAFKTIKSYYIDDTSPVVKQARPKRFRLRWILYSMKN
ncbi:MAG: hypothetical protein IPG21_18910 [Saprospiraceae bacterium]|nr:hypothetical protein [Candidatus Vicinibacter affinis]